MHPERDELGTPEAVDAALRWAEALTMVLDGAELTVVAASPALTRLAGGGRTLVGRSCRDVLAPMVGPDYLDALDAVRHTGEPTSLPGRRFTVRYADGSSAERFVTLFASPWRADDGSVRGVVAQGFDVTEEVERRRRAESDGAESRRRYEHARDLVVLLQDSLLPSALPVVPGLQTAGRYVVGQDDTGAGGDWLDVVTLPDDRVALVVGDVVGHGVAAAALMGQVRAVLGERLRAGVGLTAALEALDRFAQRVPEAHAATVAVVVVDPATGRFEYSTAGHPTPLLVAAADDTPARFLRPSGAAPLASGGGFATADDRLAEGDVLLLYSDGILERPGVAPARATVELSEAAASAARGAPTPDARPAADRVAEHTIELLVRRSGYLDDISLLAAQRTPPLEPLDLALIAEPPASRTVRRALRAWLEPLRIGALDDMALQHAVGECVTNSVEHAYRHRAGPGALRVRGRLRRDGVVEVVVLDEGAWRQPRDAADSSDAYGSRGLAMATQLVDRVAVEPGPEGTTVRLELAVTRDVVLLDVPDGGSGAGAAVVAPADELSTVVDGPLLTASGALDLAGSDDLRIELMRLVAGSHPQVSVDLSRLTLLASAGVQVLFDARQRARDQGVDLTIVAAPGTVAQHVLDLVRLPHDAPDATGPVSPTCRRSERVPTPMSTRHRDLDADAARVWAVLADGWLYPLWVVGASRMREVDVDWPGVGSRLHHSAGAWPLLVDDTTQVLESDENRLLRLRARGWPAGEAEVVVELLPRAGGTRVVLHEDAVRGPGRLVPKPVRDVQLGLRNDESLRRLALIVENRR